MGPDGTVMIGLPFTGTEQVELVLDGINDLRLPHTLTPSKHGKMKISFHASGQYKFESKMGLSQEGIDRVTVIGPRLEEISEPRRMLELLLPPTLPLSLIQPTQQDIVLDATTSPERPLRCTIFCMARDKFHDLAKQNIRFVDTSMWEANHALENQSHVWTWTLRASREDEIFPDKILTFLPGQVKWGSLPIISN